MVHVWFVFIQATQHGDQSPPLYPKDFTELYHVVFLSDSDH